MKRHIALLGGTTTFGDVLIALPKLLSFYNLIEGPKIKVYEKAFAKKVGTQFAYSFTSGRVGLYGVLKSLGVGDGDEVLLQVPSHIVVANAIRYTGAKPIYADCNLYDYNIDIQDAKSKITSKTKVLILQHTFGIPANIDGALEICNKNGLFLIEDCVHALGATYNGKQIGSFGHAAFFSTEDTKVISSTMGGMVVTNDDELATKLNKFQEQCSSPGFWLTYGYILKFVLFYFALNPYVHKYTRGFYEFFGEKNLPLPGATTQLELEGKLPKKYEKLFSNAQSIIGIRQLDRLESNLQHRRKIAKFYENELQSSGLKPINYSDKANPAFVRYPLWVSNKDVAVEKYKFYGALGTWFTSVLEEALSPSYGDYIMGSCPNAELASKHLINLPTHPKVKVSDAEKLFAVISNLVSVPVSKDKRI